MGPQNKSFPRVLVGTQEMFPWREGGWNSSVNLKQLFEVVLQTCSFGSWPSGERCLLFSGEETELRTVTVLRPI